MARISGKKLFAPLQRTINEAVRSNASRTKLRNSQLTWPDFTYWLISAGTPFSSNSRQCGQVSEPNSTSFTLALGLPIMKLPASVALTTIVQSPPLGGLTCCSLALLLVAASPCFELQPAIATTARAPARKAEGFIQLLRLITGIGLSSCSCSIDGGPLLAAICAASDSRQARSSGSAISRSPSPSSLGTGRSCGRCGLDAGAGGLPCRNTMRLIAT